MKHFAIIIPEGDCSITNIEGTHQIFSEVNSYFTRRGKDSPFKIQLVGLRKEPGLKKGAFVVHPDAYIDEVQQMDLIIIPAMQMEMKKALEINQPFVPWLINQYNKGAEVASLCIGSFLLASTGLLNGRKCATHWVEADNFKTMFPEVDLVADKIITDEQGLYSSGGAYSSLNLVLYLVEKYAGREIAIHCSKIFQIEIDRNSQSPFMIFNPQKDHQDDIIKRAQVYIEANYSDRIAVDELASKLAISRRNLERRFKKVTYNSIVEYIQRVRIEAAKMTLESNGENVNEAMYKSGYSDSKAFRTTFRKYTGLSPMQYKNKYSQIRSSNLQEA
jgi:transcriptional regulator GlxA family with amidase domain